MKKCLICFLALTCLSCTTKVNISVSSLEDKIKGGWAGQTFGCAYGGPTEFRYLGNTIPDGYVAPWDGENRVKWYFDNAPGLYDDVYMDFTFLDVMNKDGLDAPAKSFALSFADAGYPLWHANQAARYNILNGIMPPESGHWENNPHADDIDFQIEADFAGLVSPAMPDRAAVLADRVGHIMNCGDGYYGGLFVATMYSLAFVYDDINLIVQKALSAIPQESTFFQCISDVIIWHGEYDDWKDSWARIQEKWATETGCPDGVDSPFDIDAKINSAYVVTGLLYGGGDIEKSMEISMRCGQDSDCNPATCAGILGTMMGYSNIPDRFRRPIEEVLSRNFAYTEISLADACDITKKLALDNIISNGGKVDGDILTIPMHRVKASGYEKCFDRFRSVSKDSEGCGKLADSLAFAFDGSGIVLCGGLNCPDSDYAALVKVTLDGQFDKTMTLPASFAIRKCDIYWNYGMSEGQHDIALEWLNPVPDASIYVNSKLVYK